MEFLLFQASSLYSPGDETSIQQWKIPIYRFITIYRRVIDMFFLIQNANLQGKSKDIHTGRVHFKGIFLALYQAGRSFSSRAPLGLGPQRSTCRCFCQRGLSQ